MTIPECAPTLVPCPMCQDEEQTDDTCGLCANTNLVSHAIRLAWIEQNEPPPEAA